MTTHKQPRGRYCLFCGGRLLNTRAKEHVFPQWLLEHLGIRQESISPTHYNAQTKEPVSSRSQILDNLKEGRVCAGCNNGWMSRLEDQSKKILVPLFRAERTIVELIPHERILLARWAAKTAYVLNSSSNFHKNVPPDHFRLLYTRTDSLPDRVIVLAQQHHGHEAFYWLQSSSWRAYYEESGDMNQEVIEKMSREGYKIYLQFGKLLLLIAFWPFGGMEIRPLEGYSCTTMASEWTVRLV